MFLANWFNSVFQFCDDFTATALDGIEAGAIDMFCLIMWIVFRPDTIVIPKSGQTTFLTDTGTCEYYNLLSHNC